MNDYGAYPLIETESVQLVIVNYNWFKLINSVLSDIWKHNQNRLSTWDEACSKHFVLTPWDEVRHKIGDSIGISATEV